MSRHRNIRSMNYDEEYDDVYEEVASSFDEHEYGVSPTTARQYLYQYNPSDPEMGSRIRTMSITEEKEEDVLKESQLAWNQSNKDEPVDRRTYSCMEKVQDVIGDAFDDSEVIAAIKASNYNHEKAIDILLKREVPPASNSSSSSSLPVQTSDPSIPQPAPFSRTSALSASTTQPKPELIASKPQSAFMGFFNPKGHNPPPKPTSDNSQARIHSEPKKPIAPVVVLPKASKDDSTTAQKPKNKKLGGKKTDTPQDSPASIRKFDISDGLTPQESPISTPRLSQKFPTVKQKTADEITALYDQYLKQNNMPKINLVIVGHVDAGKSTIMGHLLYLKGSVSQKVIHRNEVDSKKVGKASFMFAWVLDQTEEERARGVTIDVGQHHFQTEHRFVTILDAPGHRDFIPNMIVGATKADVAILVVDATNGEFETGFESGGQTQEHTLLLRSLGISQLAVVVNKIDNAGYSQERFDNIQEKLTKFLKQVGFKENSLYFIPVSGLTGDNLVVKSKNPQFEWFKGKTLIEVIDEFSPNERPVTLPFRMAVKDVFKGPTSGVCVAGKIDSGFVELNQKLLVKPSNEVVNVKSIYTDEKCVDNGFAGDVLTLNLAIDDSFELLPGTVLADISTLQNPVVKFEARIMVYNNITKPVILGFPVLLYSVCVSEVGKISKMISTLNKKNDVVKKNPRYLTKNDMAIVEFTVQRPVWFELYQDFKEYGRFVFRSGDVTIGAGVVTKILA